MGVAIRLAGVGRAEAGRSVGSEQYDARFGWPSGRTFEKTGVRTRRFAAAEETASALAERAARTALAQAGVAPDEVDLVLGACGVMEQPIPSFAALLHARLGLQGTGIPAWDVNATCLSFLAALRVASLEIQAGAVRRALIASADIASAALDEDDPDTAPLFGDGAAAAVVEAGPGDLRAWSLRTFSEGVQATWLGAGGSRLTPRNLDALLAEAAFRMDGAGAYRVAARHIEPFVAALLNQAGWRMEDVDLVAPHQASGPALELMRRKLGIPREKLLSVLETCGNQVAASLPTALAVAVESGRAGPGTRLLLIGTGAGVSIAGAAWRL